MTAFGRKTVRVKIKRSHPASDQEDGYATYEVPIGAGWSVTNVLRYICEHIDGSVAYYLSCRLGICKECIVRVNGKPKLACTEIVTGDVVLDPVSRDSVIKDLICFPKSDNYTR